MLPYIYSFPASKLTLACLVTLCESLEYILLWILRLLYDSRTIREAMPVAFAATALVSQDFTITTSVPGHTASVVCRRTLWALKTIFLQACDLTWIWGARKNSVHVSFLCVHRMIKPFSALFLNDDSFLSLTVAS